MKSDVTLQRFLPHSPTQIAKVLLHNQKVWSANGKGGPILVVCYTNHALDQFLEGILEYHPEGIIRVGGRSQSEKIQELSLSKLKQVLTKSSIDSLKWHASNSY